MDTYKKAESIIKVYNDLSFTQNQWMWIAFLFQEKASPGILNNMLSFIEGINKYYHDQYLSEVRSNQDGLW
jgi:hypothetical protein